MLDLVEPALRAELAKSDSPEQKKRIKQLLELPPLLRDPERIRRWRAVAVLEQIGTPEARKLLELVAQSPAGSTEEQAARAALRRLEQGTKPSANP